MEIDRHDQLTRLIDRMVLDDRLKPVHIALSLACVTVGAQARFNILIALH